VKSERLQWAGHVSRMGETMNKKRILVRKPLGKRPLGRSRRRREFGRDDGIGSVSCTVAGLVLALLSC
jgi:hypothetical protein